MTCNRLIQNLRSSLPTVIATVFTFTVISGLAIPGGAEAEDCIAYPCEDHLLLEDQIVGTEGYDVLVEQIIRICQDACELPGANSLSYTAGLQTPETENYLDRIALCACCFNVGEGFLDPEAQVADFTFSDVRDGSYIEAGDYVQDKFCMWLHFGNTFALTNVTWYSDGSPCPRTLPNHLWRVAPPVAAEKSEPGQYAHRFTILNIDTLLTMELGDIQFAWSDTNLTLQAAALPLPADTVIAAVTLFPGDSLVVDLLTDIGGVPTPLYAGHIYGMYEIASPTIPGESSSFVFDHFVESPRSENVPALSQWGLIILGVLLPAVAVLLMLRRRKLRATE